MITGYNTDVPYGDVVLHVQTEDKGHSNPFIESLIYYGGQVVVAKRAGYAEIISSGKGEDAILALMDQQHRMMTKAIRAGKFDDTIRKFLPEGKSLHKSSKATSPGMPIVTDDSQTLDQVILDYLSNEAEQEQLVLVMEEEVELRAGSRVALALRTRSSKDGHPIAGAAVRVKMISTVGGPSSLADGRTDDDGFVQLPVSIPEVERGSAALIITAASGIGRAELKHLL
jgi:hypothetical protein